MMDTNSTAARTASVLAAATAAVFFLLLAVVHLHGISQQYFELVHTPEKYTEELAEHRAALNIIFVLDNIFIILYTCTTLFVAKALSSRGPAFISTFVVVLAAAVGLLDFIENFHIYAMMQQAADGITAEAASIRWQAAESMLKWHLAYAAFLMLGFLLPAGNGLQKMLKYSLWFFFVPTGVLVYAAAGTKYAALFQWVRYINLLSGFVLLHFIMKELSRKQEA